MAFRRILPLVVTLMLAACAQPPVPVDTFYRLEVPEPAAGRQVFDGVVEVRAFDADGLAAERPLIYSEPGSPTLRQYNYHFWVESPAVAVQSELADSLRAGA